MPWLTDPSCETDEIVVRANSGADQGPEPRLNFIDGTGISITAVDDPGSSEVDITITATGGASIQTTYLPVRKASAGTIPARTPLESVSWNVGGWLEVEAADAATASKMPAVGMANSPITNAATVNAVTAGRLGSVDTQTPGWSVGDGLYVASGGGLTNARPTGAGNGVQRVGEVIRVNVTNGEILVQGAGRINDVKNITTGKIWEGDGTGVAVEVEPDGRYTPAAHDTTHQNGGSDEINVAGLNGLLADPQVPNLISWHGPEFDECVAGWPTNVPAPLAPDTLRASALVRRFDDTAVEAVGMWFKIPAGVTNVTFHFISRAQSSPTPPNDDVVPRIRACSHPDGAGPGGSFSAYTLTALVLNGTNWAYDSQTVSLATLSWTAGDEMQIALERYATDAGDTLPGDWCLLRFALVFS